MNATKLAVIRTIRTARFEVELAEHVEFENPADCVAWDDPEAEREYVERIETGELPWYCLGVHVYVRESETDQGRYRRLHPRREIGSAYLGCVDTLDLHAVGVRDVVAEAIADARQLLEVAL